MAKKPALAAVQTAPAVNIDLLKAIASATAVSPFFMHVNRAEAETLGNLVEINPDAQFADADGNPAVRVSALGTEKLASTGNAVTQPETSTATAAPAAKPKFTVVPFVLPAAKRAGSGGARPEVYPFSSLEVGQAFFVPATAEKAEPWKSFASTVASATNRYNETVEGETRVNRKGKTVAVTKQTKKFELRGPYTIDAATAVMFDQPVGTVGAVVGRTK